MALDLNDWRVLFTRPNIASYTYTVVLDDETFRLKLVHNERDGAYYCDISNAAGVVIRSSIKLVTNWPLLRVWQADDRPQGELMVHDERSPAFEVGLSELGVEGTFLYVTAKGVADSAPLAETFTLTTTPSQ